MTRFILAFILVTVIANADATQGCQAGKLVKDPVTGKIVREVSKETECSDKDESIITQEPDAFDALLQDSDEDEL